MLRVNLAAKDAEFSTELPRENLIVSNTMVPLGSRLPRLFLEEPVILFSLRRVVNVSIVIKKGVVKMLAGEYPQTAVLEFDFNCKPIVFPVRISGGGGGGGG